MKKIYLLFCLCFMATFSLTAQVEFADDFEGYAVGDYIGSNSSEWTTWSGATGNAEDATVNADQAASGANSIYFSSTAAGGGPQDVVLPFGAKYESGLFKFSMNVYVEAGAGAYWNFQGETAIGVTWAHNCYFLDTGELQFSNSDNALAIGTTYEPETWINVAYEIDLTNNAWKVLVDGECLGSFANGFNAIASLDLFPLAGHAFYVDDVTYSHSDEVEIRNYDASISVNDLGVGGLTGDMQAITGTITNPGQEAITSVELEVVYPDGPQMITLSDLNILNGESSDFTLPQMLTLVEGTQEVSVNVVTINGSEADEDPCNSRSARQLLGVTPAEGKGIIVEEGTGTWCGWCPRGEVFINSLTEKYNHRFIGIAVHNGDPMVVTGYDGMHGFAGYPGATVMRASADTGFGSQGDLELPFLEYIAAAPKGTFETSGTFTTDNRMLTINTVVSANVDLTSDHRMTMILTEDGVTGGNGYAQSNFYSGGANGPMGGYEDLPPTVPAEDMVYNHVARAIPLGFDGEDSFAEMIPAGSNRTYTYDLPISEEFDINNMSIVFALLNPDGTIDNGHSAKVSDVVEFGTSAIEDVITENINVFPNPANEMLNIQMTGKESANIQIDVTDAVGKVFSTNNFQTIVGANTYSININTLPTGMYYAVLRNENTQRVVKFVKQ